jgi:hypothetical protein
MEPWLDAGWAAIFGSWQYSNLLIIHSLPWGGPLLLLV